MGNKKTAIDWLMMQLPVFIRVDLYEKELYQQAKAMEKEQIKDAFKDGFKQGNYEVQAIEFYSQTYKKKDNEQ